MGVWPPWQEFLENNSQAGSGTSGIENRGRSSRSPDLEQGPRRRDSEDHRTIGSEILFAKDFHSELIGRSQWYLSHDRCWKRLLVRVCNGDCGRDEEARLI